jgi:hypothetical protein
LELSAPETARDIGIFSVAEQPESDTDHTVMLALIACALAPIVDARLDVGLVAQYALVHDLVEAYAGTRTPCAPSTPPPWRTSSAANGKRWPASSRSSVPRCRGCRSESTSTRPAARRRRGTCGRWTS